MFEGKPIRLGEQDYVIPPLSLKQVKALKGDIEALDTSEFSDSALDTVIKLVHAALSRNYPSISVQQLEEWIDLGNVKQLVDIILGQSGFKLGEAVPVESSTGTAFTH